MADNEMYRVDFVIGVDGIENSMKELRTFDKFVEQTTKRAALIGKIKASPAMRIEDRVSGPAKKVKSTLDSIDKTNAKPRISLTDRVSPAAKVIRSTLSGLAKTSWTATVKVKDLAFGTINRIKNALFSLPGLLGLGGGAYGGIIAPLNLAGQMEQSEIAFETMLGSAAKAKSFIGDLMEFANKTPFEFPELQDSSKRLLAFGFAAERVLPMLEGIGNASAGLSLGGEGVSRISVALGQMRAKSKVSAEEMLQLTEAGIPAWDILAQKMRISTAEVMKLASKGVIPADKAIDALIDGMNERFPNLMDKQSNSLLGLWSNIKDVFNNKILMRWGDGIRSAIQPRLQKLSDWFSTHPDVIERWGKKLQDAAKEATEWISRKFEDAFSYIRNRYLDNPDFQKLDFGGKVDFIISDLADQLRAWYNDTGRDKLVEFGKTMGSALAQGIGETIKDGFKNLVDVNKEAITNPNKETLSNAGGWNLVALAGGTYLAQRLGVFKLIKSFLGKGAAAKAAAGAAGAAGTAATAAGASVAASATRELVKGNPTSPYAKGWNPRYVTPPKPDVMPKYVSPGISTAAKVVRGLFAPEFLIPQLTGQYLSHRSRMNTEAKRAQFYETYWDNPEMMAWGNLPQAQRMGVNQSDLSSKISTKPVDFLTPDTSATVEFSDEQLNNITSYLQGLKNETTNVIQVNVPPDAVNLQVQDKSELNYDEISKVVGKLFSDSIRRVVANQP